MIKSLTQNQNELEEEIKEIRNGNFSNIASYLSNTSPFENYNYEAISLLLIGCLKSKNTRLLYLIFLEVSKITRKTEEDIKSLSNEKLLNIKKKVDVNNTTNFDIPKNQLEKWYKYTLQGKHYSHLMESIFDIANSFQDDYYAQEIIKYFCTSNVVKERKYALFNIDKKEIFLDDEDEEIKNIASELMHIEEEYNNLPLDGKLLVGLLEEAFKDQIIKYNRSIKPGMYHIFSSLFIYSYKEFEIPSYYFDLSDNLPIAMLIYSKIISHELEFKEEMEPIFFNNLSSNNIRL